MKKYFGTDGVRGKINETLSVELVQKIGKSMGILDLSTIVVGYDTRESNYMLSSSLISGILSVGIDVIDAGVISTPALAYYSYIHNMVGIMITASHNPYYDNGIKIFEKGRKISDELEELIENTIDDNLFKVSNNIGNYIKSDDPKLEYIKFLKKYMVSTDKKIVLDLANGATYEIAEKIYKNVCEKLSIIGNNPNGVNINLECGATNPNEMISLCKKLNYDYGISFDGDGDRIIISDNIGNIYSGDHLIFLLAKHFKENKVVLTKNSNIGIINEFKKNNIEVYLSDVGDKKVLELMDELDINIGGENSGHIIIKDILPTGDGLLISLIVLNIISNNSGLLFELLKLKPYPEKNINIKTKNKDIELNNLIQDKINKFNNENKDYGKAMLRASGTEDLIRLYACHKNEDRLDEVISELLKMINNLLDEGSNK